MSRLISKLCSVVSTANMYVINKSSNVAGCKVQDYLDLLYLWLWLLLSPERHHSQENNPTVQLLQLRQTRLWYLHFQAEGLSFQAGEGGQCFQNLAFQFQQFQKFWNRIRKSQSGMIFEQNFWIWMLETKSSVWRQRELSISIWPVNQKNCTFFFQAYIWCMHFNCSLLLFYRWFLYR